MKDPQILTMATFDLLIITLILQLKIINLFILLKKLIKLSLNF